MLLGVLCSYTFPLPSNRNLALNKDENQNNANKDEGGKKVHLFISILLREQESSKNCPTKLITCLYNSIEQKSSSFAYFKIIFIKF